MRTLLSILVISILGVFTFAFTSTAQSQDKVEVTISGNDKMQFDKKEIKVKAGQTVVLTLKHPGKLPKAAMGHNWVLLKPGTKIPEFAATASKFADNDYIPKDTKDVIVHTKLIGGGQETTIEFTAPAKGTYDFICSFPGHYALMHGKFIVE
jgi:azurin